MIRAWFDGACGPVNPGGHTTYGFHVRGKDFEDSGYGYVGEGPLMSNNVAEYSGLIAVMEWLLKHGMQDEEITVYGDSNMVIQQMSGHWRVRRQKPQKPLKRYLPFCAKAMALVKQFRSIEFFWIPRESNGVADDLSKRWFRENGVSLGWAARMHAKASGRPAFEREAAA